MSRNRVIVLLAGLTALVVLVVIVVLAWTASQRRFKAAQKKTDERIVSGVKDCVRRYLSNLPAEHEITQLYGKVERLSFGQYERRKTLSGMVKRPGKLVVKCEAQFERGQNVLTIAVWKGDSLRVGSIGVVPDFQKGKVWGKYRTEIRNSTLTVISEDGSMWVTPQITIEVTHPDFEAD